MSAIERTGALAALAGFELATTARLGVLLAHHDPVEAIAKFAVAYARQTEQDHAALDKARRAGRIKVADGSVV